MIAFFLVAGLGFSLDKKTVENNKRKLLLTEPCKSSCDSGFDSSCDEQDEDGAWALGCDMHPTKSCDADCHYSPPPPAAPWQGIGGYPSPPPNSPPSDDRMLPLAIMFFVIAAIFFVCVCVMAGYGNGTGNGAERTQYWCFCCLPGLRGRSSWEDREEEVTKAEQVVVETGVAVPTLNLPSLVL